VHCAAWPARRTPRTPRTLRKKLDSKTLPRVDVLAVDCVWLADQLAASEIAVPRVLLDLPGVNLARVVREADQRAELPEANAWVGYAGRLERTRGLPTLVEAGRLLSRRRAGVHVALAGEGPARAELLRSAVPADVFWLPGPVPSVPGVLAALDVCCFPSTAPGTPTSLLEAAALGRPIVAAAVPGIEELYADGREIVLVPPEDPSALAAAIQGLLEDPRRARAMGEAARVRTVDDYSSKTAVKRYLDLYRELMAQ
jgi:glycosyltransferase involved in cell wall biosynthesis